MSAQKDINSVTAHLSLELEIPLIMRSPRLANLLLEYQEPEVTVLTDARQELDALFHWIVDSKDPMSL